MATLHAPDRRVSGSIPEWFRFGFVDLHSKIHSKGAKIPQFHSKYSKFRMYQGLSNIPRVPTIGWQYLKSTTRHYKTLDFLCTISFSLLHSIPLCSIFLLISSSIRVQFIRQYS